MAFNFPSYLGKTILSYLRGRTFEASFQAAPSSRRDAGGINLPCSCQSVYQCHARPFPPRLGVLGSLRKRRNDVFIRNDVLLYRQLILCVSRLQARCSKPHSESAVASIQVFALLLLRLDMSVTGKFTRIWEFRFFADHIRVLTDSFDSNVS